MRLSLGNHPGVVIIGVAVIVLVVWGFWPQPLAVEAVLVNQDSMAVTIEEEGRTRVHERYVVSAPVDGVACRIDLHVGDPVKQGQLLLTLSPLESQVLDPRSRAAAEARVAAAKSALESARQQAESAEATRLFQENEVNRLRPLFEKGVVSRGEFEKAQTGLRVAEAALKASRHGVEVARYEAEAAETALRYSAGSVGGEAATQVPIRSPIDGKILKVPHECAGPVRTGDPLLEVGDPTELEVEVDLLSADAVKVKHGMRVLLDRWGGERPLEGRVRIVEPVGFTKFSALGVEEQRVLVIVDIVSPKEAWELLGDGYSVEARFVLWEHESALQVPASSLFRHADGWALFTIEDDRAKMRPVQVGQRNGLRAQIVEGVSAGEWVIDHPADEMEDGQRVTQR